MAWEAVRERQREVEEKVLELRSAGKTLQEVSAIMGWKGRERARQIEARARRKRGLGPVEKPERAVVKRTPRILNTEERERRLREITERRFLAVRRVHAGERPSDVAAGLGILASSIYRWYGMYLDGGPEALKPKVWWGPRKRRQR